MSVMGHITLSIAIGVLAGTLSTSVMTRLVDAGPSADLVAAIRALVDRSDRLVERLGPPAKPPATAHSNSADDPLSPSSAREVERAVRAIAIYAAQVERALQGIDKAMSTMPKIDQRADRVKAVTE